jgi:hypothetical protein
MISAQIEKFFISLLLSLRENHSYTKLRCGAS